MMLHMPAEFYAVSKSASLRFSTFIDNENYFSLFLAGNCLKVNPIFNHLNYLQTLTGGPSQPNGIKDYPALTGCEPGFTGPWTKADCSEYETMKVLSNKPIYFTKEIVFPS